jgi:hypothetical protein
MSVPVMAVVADSEARRWRAWQERGAADDRRRAVAMKWVLAIIAIILGGVFGRLL